MVAVARHGDGAWLMADVIPFRSTDRRHDLVTPEHFAEAKAVPEGESGQFVEMINDLARQWAARRNLTAQKPVHRNGQRRTSRAGLVADVIDIRTRRPILDPEAALAMLGRPMTELEVVLDRFGAAIAERERQRHAAEEKPE
jgi:hypothetical protein